MIWLNGEFIDDDAPVYTIGDRIRLGECVFGTILAVDGQPQFWDAHIEKLESHLKLMGLSYDFDSSKMLHTAQELLHKNNAISGQTSLNIFVTGGSSGAGIKPPANRNMNISMRTAPLPDQWPPIDAIIAKSTRRNEGSPLSQIKCSNYGDHILAAAEAADRGANEAILLNNAGHITCATVASLFMVKNGALYTPPLSDGVQAGVTRKRIIQQLDATEQTLTPKDLVASDGLYLANSLRGVQSVLSLDGKDLPISTIIPKDFHIE